MRIAEISFPVPIDKTFHYAAEPAAIALKPGLRVRAPFGPRKLVGFVVSVFDGTPARPLKSIEKVMDENPVLSEESMGCASWMSKRTGSPLGECLKAFAPPFFIKEGPPPRELGTALGSPSRRPWTLTSDQNEALKRLSNRLREEKFHAVVLYGVPASGKTEVYLRLIEEVVKGGGQALFLVPEISLTGPFFDEFSRSLTCPVGLWHSRAKTSARRRTWMNLRWGIPQLVVGARSAVLLPFSKLRLIVVDEEQDESFKQEGQSPYYHARETALHRAENFKALIVLGSATPSLESWDMARRGLADKIEMRERVSALARPAVLTIAHSPGERCLSGQLVEKIQDRLKRGEQTILLVNRRGFATLMMCRRCGWVSRCPSCGVAQVQHQDPVSGFILRCHHCESKAPVPSRCGKCGQEVLKAVGAGTQKIAGELKARLPEARVLRFDRDALAADDKERENTYEKFKARQADVLVGTKLVAKSFHFPDVTLVGVVDSDLMISMPDFRSSERAMQLLAQVAGRSGRADKPGEVVLQTLCPDHPAVLHTVGGDYSLFAEAELETRKALRYPPYSTLTRLVWEGAKRTLVRSAAEESAGLLREALGSADHQCVGPSPCVLSVLRGLCREHLLIKSRPEICGEALSAAKNLPGRPGVRLKISVDPYDLF